MKTIVKQLKNRKLYYETFSNYTEYLNVLETREKAKSHTTYYSMNNLASNTSDSYVKDIEEAKNIFLNGWETPLQELKQKIDEGSKNLNTKKVLKYYNDVAGFIPIIPNSLMGLPNNMLNLKSDFKKQKVLHFMIVLNRRYSYTPTQIIDKMSKIFAKIMLLERNGYRCRIETFVSLSAEYSSKTMVAHSVLIKSEKQPMDVKRVCFPLVHPAMQKVFGWGWGNCLPLNYNDYSESGLGSSIQYWSGQKRQEVIDAIKEKNEKIIVVGMETNLKDMEVMY